MKDTRNSIQKSQSELRTAAADEMLVCLSQAQTHKAVYLRGARSHATQRRQSISVGW